MAYVPSFEYDVFLSYAHADNFSGRVTEFHRELRERLTVALGSKEFRKPEEWIFMQAPGIRRSGMDGRDW